MCGAKTLDMWHPKKFKHKKSQNKKMFVLCNDAISILITNKGGLNVRCFFFFFSSLTFFVYYYILKSFLFSFAVNHLVGWTDHHDFLFVEQKRKVIVTTADHVFSINSHVTFHPQFSIS